jgi:hypothetical protein
VADGALACTCAATSMLTGETGGVSGSALSIASTLEGSRTCPRLRCGCRCVGCPAAAGLGAAGRGAAAGRAGAAAGSLTWAALSPGEKRCAARRVLAGRGGGASPAAWSAGVAAARLLLERAIVDEIQNRKFGVELN